MVDCGRVLCDGDKFDAGVRTAETVNIHYHTTAPWISCQPLQRQLQ